MTLSLVMHDWRLLERVIGLTSRLGCAYTRVDVRAGGEQYHATIDFVGTPEALRRLDLQLARLLNDDKEMSR